jgi:hypothetical protein
VKFGIAMTINITKISVYKYPLHIKKSTNMATCEILELYPINLSNSDYMLVEIMYNNGPLYYSRDLIIFLYQC